jgi:hypothetical protein
MFAVHEHIAGGEEWGEASKKQIYRTGMDRDGEALPVRQEPYFRRASPWAEQLHTGNLPAPCVTMGGAAAAREREMQTQNE